MKKKKKKNNKLNLNQKSFYFEDYFESDQKSKEIKKKIFIKIGFISFSFYLCR
tara:strand:- start:231 stop:389 length:159 start_codon:yes stop_codon:yes gene_type:complete